MPIDLTIIDAVERILPELHDTTPEHLLDFWFVCNQLTARWRHPSTLTDPIESSHHARIALWMQQQLFAQRTRPLQTKGIFRDLTSLIRTVEKTLHGAVAPHTDANAERTMLQARLGLISLAPGLENHELATLAGNLEVLLHDDPSHPWPSLPENLRVHLEAIINAMERELQTENLTIPSKNRGTTNSDEIDEIPDLVDF